MHPKHEVNKVYRVTVRGCTEEALEKLGQPIVLDGYRIRKPEVRFLSGDVQRSWLEVTIHEGRNRQVRRMCAAAGMEVLRLVRIREGNLELGNLPLGKWRYLTEDEAAGIDRR